MTTYTTRAEAIDREIIEPLGEYAAVHDVDAIADTVLTTTGHGTDFRYTNRVDVDFWDVVAANALD